MDWNTNYRSTVSTHGLPPFPRCFSRLVDTDTMINNNVNVSSYQQEGERILREKLENLCKKKILSHFDVSPEENGMDQKQWRDSSFCKLNVALVRLRSEMSCLRHLDLNLLCQLWSLSDAIQDYKFTLQDRHSESNSECSSNFCWTDSLASFDDFDSTDDHLADTCSIGRSDSFCGSTSSLWQQINELREKAETDFTIGV